MRPTRPRLLGVALAVLLASACASSEPAELTQPEPTMVQETAQPEPAEPETSEPAEPTPAPEVIQPLVNLAEPASVFEIVSTLASDEFMGRNNQSETSAATQEFLMGQLELFAPAQRYEYDQGTNLLAIIPGTDLADEYLLVGAHYDHVGNQCRGVTTQDNICNGAADNASGVAAAIAVGRTLAEQQPRRSVIIALWDGEEDGLVGATRFVVDPIVPLDQIVGYVNFDIQGAHLSPSLAEMTLVIGAETGGPNLIAASAAAAEASPLDVVSFNLIFGQGRSDHAPFAAAAVPVVFFTDATNGCYHTVTDDLNSLDFDKLDMQIETATRLAVDLASTDTAPVFDRSARITTFSDAVTLQTLVSAAQPDFPLFGVDAELDATALLVLLDEIVQAGPEGYVGPAANTVLSGAAQLIERLASAPCLPVS